MSPSRVLPKRTLAEIVAKRRLEPETCDVFVEGFRDARLVRWVLVDLAAKLAVYPIERIDVPEAEVVRLGFERNNRGRVMTLARSLADSGVDRRAACIVDVDLDIFVGSPIAGPLLLQTDYASSDCYLFDPRVIEKAQALALAALPDDPPEVLAKLAQVLVEVFLVRAADRVLDLNLGALDFTRVCEIAGTQIEFDRLEYVRRYLNRGGLLGRLQEFEDLVAQLRTRMPVDPRHTIHGRDFLDLLCWYLRRNGAEAIFCRPEALRGLLGASLERDWLADEQMFRRLREVAST